jgi:prokaryotic ubiquitin-like protein Pup
MQADAGPGPAPRERRSVVAGPDRSGGQRGAERRRRDDDVPPPTTVEQTAGRALIGDVDDLLDEIDAVLEDNAEEFVRGYVQKGGQ